MLTARFFAGFFRFRCAFFCAKFCLNETALGCGFCVFFLFFCLLCLAYALLLSFYSLYNCRNNKIYFGKMVSVCGSKGQKLYESALFYDKIGEIKIMRFPLDVKNKTCSVRITLRTANGTSVKAKYVSYPILKEQIDKKLKLYE